MVLRRTWRALSGASWRLPTCREQRCCLTRCERASSSDGLCCDGVGNAWRCHGDFRTDRGRTLPRRGAARRAHRPDARQSGVEARCRRLFPAWRSPRSPMRRRCCRGLAQQKKPGIAAGLFVSRWGSRLRSPCRPCRRPEASRGQPLPSSAARQPSPRW